ncbi:MAG: hypothetical protein JSU85_09390 [Candidatus Zixiibacteriota bacterium]|nr:MAG: hypothetical protein JSU85_09390 [candidate division Zixibacteria bacterium]
MRAEIKLIAEGIDDYDIDSVTSAAAGHPKDKMQDRRIDTSWKANSTATQDIDIDTNSDTFSANYAFLYHNISDNSSSATIKIYSDDNAGFTSATQRGSTFTITPSNKPYAMISFGAGIVERYWRIRIENSDVAPEVYLVFLGVSSLAMTGFSVRHMPGQSQEITYDGYDIEEAAGGVRAARIYHDGRWTLRAQWEILDSTLEVALQQFMADVKGGARAFFLVDSDSTYHWVRILNRRLGSSEFVHELFNTDPLIFEEEF